MHACMHACMHAGTSMHLRIYLFVGTLLFIRREGSDIVSPKAKLSAESHSPSIAQLGSLAVHAI